MVINRQNGRGRSARIEFRTIILKTSKKLRWYVCILCTLGTNLATEFKTNYTQPIKVKF